MDNMARLDQIRQCLADHEQAYENDWDMPDALHDYVCDVGWLLDLIDSLAQFNKGVPYEASSSSETYQA